MSVIKEGFDNFSNEIPYKYRSWQKQLKYLYDKFDIGKAPGILQFYPNQKGSLCKSKNNLMVQDNVTFKPAKIDNGCMYVNLMWPD